MVDDLFSAPTVVIRQLTRSDQVFQLLLVPIKSDNKPSLILSDKKTIYICDFFKGNGLRITEQMSVYEGTILKISTIPIYKTQRLLIVLTSLNQLYVVRFTGRSYKVLKKISLVSLLNSDTSVVNVENPIIEANEKFVIVHSTIQMLVIISIESLLSQGHHTIVYPFNTFDVIGIKFTSIDEFEMISRDSAFQFRLVVYKIGQNDKVTTICTYNPFKEIPRLLITLNNNCSLAICDGTHLIYPPNRDFKITKNVMDLSVKLTKVSTFKILPEELKVCSYQIIDDERILILTELGEIFMEFIQLRETEQGRKIQLEKWELFKLGNLPPASNILHINENLFLSYSKESMNCFFKINAMKPYIEVLNYFQLHQFFKKNSLASRPQQNIESTPVVDINKIKLINVDLFVKIQSSLNSSLVSLKYPKYLNSSKSVVFPVGKNSNVWFHNTVVISQRGSTIKVLRFSDSKFSTIYETSFDLGKISQCFYIDNKLVIITSTSVIRENHFIYQCEPDKSILFASTLGTKVIIATSDQQVHTIDGATSHKEQNYGIVCIGTDNSRIVLGLENGTLKIDNTIRQVSSEPIVQVVVKENFIIVVDSHFKLYKIEDESVVGYEISSKNFTISDVADSDTFIIKNSEQLSINSFDSKDNLVTKLIKITSIPDQFAIFENNFIYALRGKLWSFELLSEPVDHVLELRSDELIIKSLLLRVDKTFPVLVLITLKDSTSSIKLIDLESFKTIDVYKMKEGEEIMDIIKTDFFIDVEDKTLKLDLTGTDYDFIQMELLSNGFLVNTLETGEDGNPSNAIKLFTIGGDMKLKFHYLLRSQQLNYNVDSYKLLRFNDYVISSGTFLTFFKIGINDKFKPNNINVIDEENFLENSILKIYSLPGEHKSKIFNTDLKKIADDHIVVSDVLKGLIFYKIKSNANSVSVIELEISNRNDFPETTVLLMEVINNDILIFADLLCNIFIYRFEIVKSQITLSKVNAFNLELTSHVNVIKGLDLKENHLCLLGCSNGEVLVLDVYRSLDGDVIHGCKEKNWKLLSTREDFIDQDISTDLIQFRLRIKSENHSKINDSVDEDINKVVDLRLINFTDENIQPIAGLKL